MSRQESQQMSRAESGMMIRRLTCAAIALGVASGANAATLRLKNYTTPENERQRILNTMYLEGLKDGLVILNVVATRNGAAPLFCLPPNMVLTADQADEILMHEVKEVEAKGARAPDDMPIGIVLLAGLRKTCPCGGEDK